MGFKQIYKIIKSVFFYLIFTGMKMYFRCFFVLLIILYSCSKESYENNPFLETFPFEKNINLNLPQFDNLRFSGGTVTLNNLGIKGVILFNLNEQIIAWEASCPNEFPSDCSKMEISSLQSECKCNGNKYSLATGQILNPNSEKIYPMLSYKTIRNGNSIKIYN